MLRVPRHLFVAADLRGYAYDDHPLAIGDGQTISQPYMVAFMTQALDGPEQTLIVLPVDAFDQLPGKRPRIVPVLHRFLMGEPPECLVGAVSERNAKNLLAIEKTEAAFRNLHVRRFVGRRDGNDSDIAGCSGR